jgi:hypothetical protein
MLVVDTDVNMDKSRLSHIHLDNSNELPTVSTTLLVKKSA